LEVFVAKYGGARPLLITNCGLAEKPGKKNGERGENFKNFWVAHTHAEMTGKPGLAS
jgi:hypothetical protein